MAVNVPASAELEQLGHELHKLRDLAAQTRREFERVDRQFQPGKVKRHRIRSKLKRIRQQIVDIEREYDDLVRRVQSTNDDLSRAARSKRRVAYTTIMQRIEAAQQGLWRVGGSLVGLTGDEVAPRRPQPPSPTPPLPTLGAPEPEPEPPPLPASEQ